MTTRNRAITALALAAVAIGAGMAQADVQTYTQTTSGNDSWNIPGNWAVAVPSGADDAVISSNATANVENAATPTYSGTLTLGSNSTLNIRGTAGSQNALVGASSIIMNTGSAFSVNMNANLNYPPISLVGDATIISPFGASDHQTDNVATVTGAHVLTINGFNNHTGNEKIAGLYLYGVALAPGTYDNTETWLGGTGTLTVEPPPPATFPLTITPAIAPDTGYLLAWETQGGMLYRLRSSTDLSGAISTWNIVEEDIPASTNTKLVNPGVARLFYAVERYPAPPVTLLNENFDLTDGGFTEVYASGTHWDWGAPISPANGGGAVMSDNGGTGKCWGTDVGDPGRYVAGTITSLLSPVIDLTGVAGATLTFAQALDIAGGHTLKVYITDAAGSNR